MIKKIPLMTRTIDTVATQTTFIVSLNQLSTGSWGQCNCCRHDFTNQSPPYSTTTHGFVNKLVSFCSVRRAVCKSEAFQLVWKWVVSWYTSLVTLLTASAFRNVIKYSFQETHEPLNMALLLLPTPPTLSPSFRHTLDSEKCGQERLRLFSVMQYSLLNFCIAIQQTQF